jgi:choice-of-anchor B domain-containing protein
MKRLSLVLGFVLLVNVSLASGASLGSPAQDRPSERKAAANAGALAQQGTPLQTNMPQRFAPCIRGTAHVPELDGKPVLESGEFACDRVDLMYVYTMDELGGGLETGTGRGSDVWGWTDPQTKREYVLAGKENGTAIVDITKPKRPIYLAELPTSSPENLIWRDIKVFADHAFIVSESPGHGMQVLDLTRLRDIDPADAPVTLEEDAHYDGFQRAHNIAINEDSGFAFAVDQRDDAEGCGRGMHIVNIREPTNPTFAGCYEETRVHDVQCLTYGGPDTRFTGRELCITSTGGGESVGVVDVTDKTDPVTLSLTGYPNSAFSHQGSLLDGHRFYVHDTESTTRTPQGVEIFDMADLTNPVHIGFVASVAQSTEHNLYQSGRYLHQSNYSSGLRVYDSRNVADGTLEEVGFFDVYPPNDDPGFGFGTWSNFSFDSGVVAIHGYQGLWLVKPRLGRN